MNENWNKMYEADKSISLLDLCFTIVRKWKMMIIAAIITAVLVGGITYGKSYLDNRAYLGTVAESAVKEVKLPEEGKAHFLAEISRLEEYKKNIEEYDYYLENSVKAKLDPNGFYQGTLKYMLSSSDSGDVLKALNICKTELFGEDDYKELSEQLTEHTPPSLLNEVYYAEETENNLFVTDDYNVVLEITVCHYEESECEKMLLFAENQMQEIAAELNQTVIAEKVVSGISAVSDPTLVYVSKDIHNKKVEVYEAIERIEDDMTSVQKQYYKATMQSEEEKIEAAKQAAPAVGADLKLIVIAAVAAAFCVAVLYALFYLFNGRVHTKEELESWAAVPVIQFVMDEGKKKGNIIDQAICSMQKYLQGNSEESPEIAAALIKNYAAQYDVKQVYLTGSKVLSVTDAGILKLQEILAEAGVEVKTGSSLLKDAKALQEAADCGYVVFWETCNLSKDRDVREEINKAVSCGIRVLGIALEKQV